MAAFWPPSEPGLPELVFQKPIKGPRLLATRGERSLAAAAAAIRGVGLLGLSLLAGCRCAAAWRRCAGPLALYDRQNRPLIP